MSFTYDFENILPRDWPQGERAEDEIIDAEQFLFRFAPYNLLLSLCDNSLFSLRNLKGINIILDD